MKPILTPAEASALDRETQARGIPAATLMERAGRELARVAASVAGGVYGRRAVVVCGKGNNGGDGLVAARHLARWGVRVSVLTVEAPEKLREPAAANFGRLDEVDVRVRPFSAVGAARELERADVAIDGIFGTGFRGIPEDDYAAAIGALNASDAPVVAVDIPSGVNGETGAVEGDAVWAGVTVCFGVVKPGVVLLPGGERAGIIEVVDIGFPPDLVRGDLLLVEEGDVAALLPERDPDTHKRATGIALVVGGSRTMTGAVCLAAEAAYRTGAGLVTVAVPASVLPAIQARLAEAVFLPLPETEEGTAAAAAADPLLERAAASHAVAVGPGMGTHPETAELVRRLVRECPDHLVLDADGINAFTGQAGALAERASEAVLTPHAGEFSRLASVPVRDLEGDRVGHVRKLARESDAAILLKGSRTLVGSPDGLVRVNPTGSAVLATAGSGDVLTGVIVGLMARGLPPAEAAMVGAYLHGLAGRLAGQDRGEGTVAGDVLARIPEAVRTVRGA